MPADTIVSKIFFQIAWILFFFLSLQCNLKLYIMSQTKHSSFLYRELSESEHLEFILHGDYIQYGVFIGKHQIAMYKTRVAAEMLVKLLQGSHRNISVVEYHLIPKDM